MVLMKYFAAVAIAIVPLVATSTAFAELPEGLRYDDGFAYFRTDNRGSVSGNQPTSEYAIRANARVLGEQTSRNDSFKFVFKQGNRTLGQLACGARPETDSSRRMLGVYVHNCADRDLRMSATGAIQVEVYYVSDATDAEHLARTHVIDVLQTTRFRGTGAQEPSEFVVNLHSRQPVVLIERVSREAPTFYKAAGGYGVSYPTVALNLQVSDGLPADLQLRCSVGGNPIAADRRDIDRGQRIHSATATETRVVARNRNEAEEIRWSTFQVFLPLTWGTDDTQGRARIDEHDGRWECVLRDEQRNDFLTFSFTAEGGVIAPHPEEATGLSLPPNVHLVEARFHTHAALERTDPSATQTGFFGRPWATDEVRAMARSLPAVGTPYPPSARPARAARGRRR